MDVTGTNPVKTVVLVAPSCDAADPAWGFVAKHVEALASAFARVVVVTPGRVPAVASLGAVAAPADADTGGVRRAVDQVVAATDGDAVVVVLDDPALLAQARAEVGDRSPVVWWSSQVPSPTATGLVARWADGLLVSAMPDAGTARVPTWIVGAGVDLRADAPDQPHRLPLQLLALGRTAPSKGLTTVIRAVAVARSNGVDARLTIVGPSTSALERRYRRELHTLVKDVALTSVVDIRDAVAPSAVGELITGAHALVDASDDDDLRPASLEAIAAGRPVLTSNRRLARMLPADDLALDFEPGNANHLAHRIGQLAEMWPASLARFATTARAPVEAAHARALLASQWSEAIDAVHGRVVRGAGPAPTPASTAPAADGLPGLEPVEAVLDTDDTDDTDDAEDSEATEIADAVLPVPPDPAVTVTRFLDAWAARDAERALACCEPGAARFDTATDGVGDGVLAADYLLWVARITAALESTVEEVDVVDDTVVAVRRDRWTIGDDEFTLVVRSLFEVADDRITSWSDTELAAEPDVVATRAASAPTEVAGTAPAPEPEVEPAPAPAPEPELVEVAVAVAAPASDVVEELPTVVADPPDPIARYEEQLHHWRRQAMIWRERALEARRLGEAFKANVEDLRLLVDVLTEQLELSAGAPVDAEPDPAQPARRDEHGDDQPAEPATAGDGPDELPVVRWSPAPEVPTSTNGDTTGVPATEPEPPVRPEPEASRPTEVDRYRYPPARPTLGQSLAARSTKFARLVTRTFGRPSSAPDAR